MRLQTEFFADGEWRSASGQQTHAVINPATEETYAAVAASGSADVDLAVASAKRAFDEGPWRRMTLAERCDVVLAIRDVLIGDTEQIARETASTLGQPLHQARGLGSTPALIDMYIASITGSTSSIYERTRPEAHSSRGRRLAWSRR